MKLAKVSLGLQALMYLLIGIASWVDPLWIAKGVQINLPTPVSITDFRATYGGFCIATGLYFVYCIRNHVRAGLVLQLLSAAGFGLARLYGIIFDGGVERSTCRLQWLDVEGGFLEISWIRNQDF